MNQVNTAKRSKTVSDKDYWHVYHPPEVIAKADQIRQSQWIQSTGVRIHIDTYPQTDPHAPVLIFNHGGGGYSRLFLPLALVLFERGYTVLVPDQRGQGLSEGNRSDFELGQFVQNIVDVATWARQTYSGDLFMAGGSLGGALTYKAAAAGAPVKAIICHNLYDFGNPSDTLAVSRFAPLANVPGVPQAMSVLVQALASILPSVRIPYRLLGNFNKMVDERVTGFFDLYREDPYPIRAITLRYMASLFSTPPRIPFEENTLPVLVINQTRDKMTDPAVTRRNYERLGGPKQYVEIDYGHWAIGLNFEQEWSALADQFLQEMMVQKTGVASG